MITVSLPVRPSLPGCRGCKLQLATAALPLPTGNWAPWWRVNRKEPPGEITAAPGVRKRKCRKKHAGADHPGGIIGPRESWRWQADNLADIVQHRPDRSQADKVAYFETAPDMSSHTLPSLSYASFHTAVSVCCVPW